MADVTLGFVSSKSKSNALTDSTTHQGKIYFPTDATTIIKNGKEYGSYPTSLPANGGNADTATKATQDASGNVITSTYAKKTEIPTSLPASDVYAWAKASTKPTYTASEVGTYNGDTIDELLDYKANSTDVDNDEKVASASLNDLETDLTSLTSTVEDKADKATTLSGYGITDAYTQSEVDAKDIKFDFSKNSTEVKQMSSWDAKTIYFTTDLKVMVKNSIGIATYADNSDNAINAITVDYSEPDSEVVTFYNANDDELFTVPKATTSKAGVMTAVDKKELSTLVTALNALLSDLNDKVASFGGNFSVGEDGTLTYTADD